MSCLLTEVPNLILSSKSGSPELGQFGITINFHFRELLYKMWRAALAGIAIQALGSSTICKWQICIFLGVKMDQILVAHCIFLSLKIHRNGKSLLYIAYFWHILQICQACFDTRF